MKIVEASTEQHNGEHHLIVMVDSLPTRADLRFEKRTTSTGGYIYLGEKEGYAEFYSHDGGTRNNGGFGGSIFELNMKDGTVERLGGPWSSRAGVVNTLFPECQVVDCSVYRTDDPLYLAGAHLTLDKAREAASKAGCSLARTEDGDGEIKYVPQGQHLKEFKGASQRRIDEERASWGLPPETFRQKAQQQLEHLSGRVKDFQAQYLRATPWLNRMNKRWPGEHQLGPIVFRFGPEFVPINEAQWQFKLGQTGAMHEQGKLPGSDFTQYTSEGLRSHFGIPEEVSLKDLVRDGAIEKVVDGPFKGHGHFQLVDGSPLQLDRSLAARGIEDTPTDWRSPEEQIGPEEAYRQAVERFDALEEPDIRAERRQREEISRLFEAPRQVQSRGPYSSVQFTDEGLRAEFEIPTSIALRELVNAGVVNRVGGFFELPDGRKELLANYLGHREEAAQSQIGSGPTVETWEGFGNIGLDKWFADHPDTSAKQTSLPSNTAVSFEPNWKPLEARLSPERCAEFMFMGRLISGETPINMYKHRDTRLYLNLDDQGQAYTPTYPGYVKADLPTQLAQIDSQQQEPIEWRNLSTERNDVTPSEATELLNKKEVDSVSESGRAEFREWLGRPEQKQKGPGQGFGL